MERLSKSLVFWVLMFVSIALPLSAQKAGKKQLFAANINTEAGAGVGAASMQLSTSNPDYRVRTFSLPAQAGTKVAVFDTAWPGEIVLCENGGTAGDCTYDASGNLDLEGVVVGPMFPPGVSGGMFITSLQNGTLRIRINNGSAGAGVFVRII